MNQNLQYKDTGYSWIGKIPLEWSIYPARGVFDEVKEKNTENLYDNALQFRYGEIVPKTVKGEKDREFLDTINTYQVVHPGTIMINGLNLNYDFISQRVGLVKEDGVITSAYLGVIPDQTRINPRFATYLFKAYDAQQVFHGMGSGVRKTLKFQDFKHVVIVAPSLPEQEMISNQLDEYCADINKAIDDARNDVEDYIALKQAVITRVITRGLEPHAAMKNSGDSRVGEIPSDWVLIKLKYLLSVSSGDAITNEQLRDSGEYPVYGGGEIMGYFDRYNVQPGSLIVGRVGARCGCVTLAEGKAWATDNALVIKTEVNPRYMNYLLISAQLNEMNTANAQPLITGTKIKNRHVPYTADIVLQNKIVTFLDEKVSLLDSAIDEKKKMISDLEKYRNAIIFELVTGKREVV